MPGAGRRVVGRPVLVAAGPGPQQGPARARHRLRQVHLQREAARAAAGHHDHDGTQPPVTGTIVMCCAGTG